VGGVGGAKGRRNPSVLGEGSIFRLPPNVGECHMSPKYLVMGQSNGSF